MERLPLEFFARDTLTVARELLGKHLVRTVANQQVTVRITETEAYIGRMDKACHAYGYKRTPRTETLFAQPGTVYIYLIYGMYHCLNFVTEAEGEPAAVLIRGVDPATPEDRDKLSLIRFGRRYTDLSSYQRKNFLNGPGKLCKGLSLTKEQNGLLLSGNSLYITDPHDPPQTIKAGKRIGIDYAEEAIDFPWRFYL